MDKFVSAVGNGTGTQPEGLPCNADTDLDYYDGNTVTAIWNYAQHFAMSDNSFGTTFGPSTPGAINVVSGDTERCDQPSPTAPSNSAVVADGDGRVHATSTTPEPDTTTTAPSRARDRA